MEFRCNGRVECPFDRSDEEACDIFAINKQTYQRSQSPRESTEVRLHIKILRIQNIKELESAYTLQVALNMFWNEDRLTFQNLKPAKESNLVPVTLMNELWLPALLFEVEKSEFGKVRKPFTTIFFYSRTLTLPRRL